MAFLSSVPPQSFANKVLPLRTHISPAVNRPYRSKRLSSPVCNVERGAQVDGTEVGRRNDSREARMLLWKEVEVLKNSLDIAVKAERFSDAAQLRDKIESLSLADEYFRTQTELKKAVAEERFADAARLRDVLNMLEPPPGPGLSTESKAESEGKKGSKAMMDIDDDAVNTWSETVTNGISVRIESYYMAEQSIPEQNRFLFGYKVNIVNKGSETCQLVSRHWVIQNCGGPESEVKGPGVVGRQPVLEPGESFEYTSACPITVPLEAGQSVLGSMKGSYEFCKGATGSIRFDANIDPFFFKLPFRNYRPSGQSETPWSKP